MDKNSLSLNVHIVPLGYEVERALAPFENRAVDKVILVVDEGGRGTIDDDEKTKKQETYTSKVIKCLNDKKIIVDTKYTDTFNLNELIKTLSKIIKEEKEKNNQVSINISSSGRFVSVGAAIAGMAHNITVYYVHTTGYSKNENDFDEYGVSRCEDKDPKITTLTNFQLNIPTEQEGCILELMYVKKHKTSNPWVSLNEIGKLLHKRFGKLYPWNPDIKKRCVGRPGKNATYNKKENKDANYRKEQSEFLIKFQTTLAKDLEEKKYIERKSGERKHVLYQITGSGEYALYLYGITDSINVKDDAIDFGEN